MPYAEFLIIGQYEEAIYERLYSNGKYFYLIRMTSSDETNPEVLRDENYYKTLMDSFKLGYNGSAKDVTNLSKVKNGYAEYVNYINSEAAAKKVTTWSMNFLPEWSDISASGENPYSTTIGIDMSKFVSVELVAAVAGESAEEYGLEMKKSYSEDLNESLYTLVESGNTEDTSFSTYKLVYDVKIGSKLYRYDERFIENNGFIYDITFKTSADKYSKEAGSFTKMLQSFKPLIAEEKEINEDISKYIFNNEKNRISKDDSIAEYKSKSGLWSINIPGYWSQKSYTSQNMESFSNSDIAASIIIETVENTTSSAIVADEDKFITIKSMALRSLKLTSTEKSTLNGIDVRVYTYRLEDVENEDYSDIVFRVFDKGSNSYCFMSTIPDICASKKNTSELEAIWNSLTFK